MSLECIKKFQNRCNVKTGKINKQLIQDLFGLFENKNLLDLKKNPSSKNQYYVYKLPDMKFKESVFKPLIIKIFNNKDTWNYFAKEIDYRLSKIGEILNEREKTEKVDSCAEIKILEVVFDSFNKKEIRRLIKNKEDLIFDIFMKIHKKLNWQYYCVESELWNYDLDSVFFKQTLKNTHQKIMYYKKLQKLDKTP